jgi:hypothetical protein
MALPKIELKTETLNLDGNSVTVRGMTRAEALSMNKAIQANPDKPEEADYYVVATGCDVSIDEARVWVDSSPMDACMAVVKAILALSGLGDTAPKD